MDDDDLLSDVVDGLEDLGQAVDGGQSWQPSWWLMRSARDRRPSPRWAVVTAWVILVLVVLNMLHLL